MEKLFGDLRLDIKYNDIVEGFISSGVSCIHKTFRQYKDQKSAYRFIWNNKVSEQKLIEITKRQCAENIEDKDLIVAIDTTDVRVDDHIGRITDFEGLGIIDSNQFKASIGYFLHLSYVMDAADGKPYGFSDISLFNRSMDRRKASLAERKKKQLRTPIEHKESYRWIASCKASTEVLQQARSITYVMDREADIWEVFTTVPSDKVDVVVRSKTNRKIENEQGQLIKLREQLAQQNSIGKIRISHKDERGRMISQLVSIKIGKGKIKTPTHKRGKNSAPMYYVEVKDEKHHGKSIHWILWTTKEVKTLENAIEIVDIYCKRWKIEVFFKLLKSDGFKLENTHLEKGLSLRKLTILVMEAALKVQQLKAARQGETDLKTAEIFSVEQIQCLRQLNRRLEGSTKKQQNPYPVEHLSWASWIIARLAGWKGFYGNDSPPGNKTFSEGLMKFEVLLMGYSLNN